MKNFLKLLLIASVGLCTYYCVDQIERENKAKKNIIGSSTTMTKVYNVTKDTVLVYVTIGATPGCIKNVMDIPWITDSVQGQRGLQGTFKLPPKDSTIAYAPKGIGFNGVISFNGQPSNCPDPILYPTGINQYEFQINNAFQGSNAQESINISCVHGVNCIIGVEVQTLNPFNAGPTIPVISDFRNTLNRNSLVAGVYPFGCDTCTGSKTLIPCISYPQPAHKNSVCQVQRNASQSGGLIRVLYLGHDQPLK